MDVVTLRNQVQSALSSLLGTYTLGNGSTTPACSVRGYGESLPGKTTVSGLECIILREPDLKEQLQYANVEATRIWSVFLIDWGGTGVINRAAGKLIYTFPGASAENVSVLEGLGPKAQKRVRIRTAPDGALGSGQS